MCEKNTEPSTFAFNFLSEDTGEIPSPSLKEEPSTNCSTQQRPFHWVENLDELLIERSEEELVYNDIPINAEPAIDETIRLVDLNLSSYRKPSEHVDDRQHQPTLEQESDIVSGIYEGGSKVWECSLDLVEYLSSSMNSKDAKADGIALPVRVWEVGCGHGLPGCYLLHRWIVQERRHLNWSVVFSDFNEEVVLDATISNIVLNCRIGVPPNDSDDAPINAGDVTQHVKLGSGDWKDQSKQMLDQGYGKFDLILAAETLYTEKASKDTAELLIRHLDPSNGVAFIATKRYYFGVGGGVDCFRAYATGLFIETVKVIDNGTGNIREILRITLA